MERTAALRLDAEWSRVGGGAPVPAAERERMLLALIAALAPYAEGDAALSARLGLRYAELARHCFDGGRRADALRAAGEAVRHGAGPARRSAEHARWYAGALLGQAMCLAEPLSDELGLPRYAFQPRGDRPPAAARTDGLAALAAARRALAVWEGLDLADPRNREGLARAHACLGDRLEELGDPVEAAARAVRAERLFRRLGSGPNPREQQERREQQEHRATQSSRAPRDPQDPQNARDPQTPRAPQAPHDLPEPQHPQAPHPPQPPGETCPPHRESPHAAVLEHLAEQLERRLRRCPFAGGLTRLRSEGLLPGRLLPLAAVAARIEGVEPDAIAGGLRLEVGEVRRMLRAHCWRAVWRFDTRLEEGAPWTPMPYPWRGADAVADRSAAEVAAELADAFLAAPDRPPGAAHWRIAVWWEEEDHLDGSRFRRTWSPPHDGRGTERTGENGIAPPS